LSYIFALIPNTRRQTIDKGYHPTMMSRIEAPIIPFNVFFKKTIHRIKVEK
jgi:hypothetical protein